MTPLLLFVFFSLFGVTSATPNAIIWLYAPDATEYNGLWNNWTSQLASHRTNVTGVSPCLYLIEGDGSFTTQLGNQSNIDLARNMTLYYKNVMGLDTIPLLAASGTGMNKIINDSSLAATIIEETVNEAIALNLTGYNLQLEEPGSPEIQVAWMMFLTLWLKALDNAGGKTLAVIIGGDCRARDWMYMDCGNYKQMYEAGSTNLRIITEATYEQYPPNWKIFLANIQRGLSSELVQAGLEYGPPINNPENGCLPEAISLNVSTIYLWVNPPTDQASWNGMGYFLSNSLSRSYT